MADEEAGIGYLFSGWCQAGLPHKRLQWLNSEGWQIETEGVILVVEPGMRPGAAGKPESCRCSLRQFRARLIMLYLQSEALRTGRRDVALGRSLRMWLARMGIPQGGKEHRRSERTGRASNQPLQALLQHHGLPGLRARGMKQQAIVDSAVIFLEAGADENPGDAVHRGRHPV